VTLFCWVIATPAMTFIVQSAAYAIFKQMESENEALQDAYKPWMFLFAILGAVLAYVSDKI
jgi:hypothetical protein